MARIITASKLKFGGDVYPGEDVKICPNCGVTVAYYPADIQIFRTNLGYSKEYLHCPGCGKEIVLRHISTEHM